jgi:hypothetical protein
MTIREQIQQMRGAFIEKTVAEINSNGRRIELRALGWENYPEPSWWHVAVNDQVVTDFNDYNQAIYEARDEESITPAEAIALELEYADVDGYGW